MADDTIDHRRYPRFDYKGTALVLFDDIHQRRTLAITNFRNISQGGACIMTPDIEGFAMGDRMYLMPERYRRKREAVIVNLGTGRLHLELSQSEALSEFEIAELLEQVGRFVVEE